MPEHTLPSSLLTLCLAQHSNDPLSIFEALAAACPAPIHGPIHHFLDGACLLLAAHSSGGDFHLPAALEELYQRSQQMPGAMCGYWGVCGAASSVGAALSLLEDTGPLSADGSWGRHLAATGEILTSLAQTRGPRCCKRSAYLSLSIGARTLEAMGYRVVSRTPSCRFSQENQQCLKTACPFFAGSARADCR